MKIGIVGLGSIGRRHYDNAFALGHERYSYDPAIAGEGRFRYEKDLYDWCDAVVIATPGYCHEAGLRACIERGKHALVEKPISTSLGQLAGLLLEATRKNLVVMIGNNLRFHPCVIKAEQWLAAGLIGKPLWAQFTCAQKSTKPLYLSDGVILNTGAHEVDLAMHLLGSGTPIYASARWAVDQDNRCGSEDLADFGLIHGCHDVRSSFHLDFVSPIPTREFRIVGDDGMMCCNLIRRNIYRQQADPKLPGIIHTDNYFGTGSWDDDYLDELTAFIDLIEGREARGASGSDGYVTLGKLLDVRKMAGL